MPSKKISTLFIITLHIFSHFSKTFNLHKVHWLYLTLVTWIELALSSAECALVGLNSVCREMVSSVTIVFYDKVWGRNKVQMWLFLVCCGFFIWKRYNRTHFHRTILWLTHCHWYVGSISDHVTCDGSEKFWGSKGVIDFSWRLCVHKSCDTQKSMDCKQAKKNIRDLHVYVNIKSRVDS